jgi:AcrR family transcriptional regulator
MAKKAGSTSDEASDERVSRREQRRQLRQDVGRTQLLDAAEEVFGEFGFHDTTLKAIAERAEFSVGSVYTFFENKDDLFLSVLLRRGAEFVPGMQHAVDRGDTPLAELHELVDFEVGFFRQHPHFGRLYLRSGSIALPVVEVPVSPGLSENFQQAMDIQAGIFERGQEAGELCDGDPLVLARLLSGLISGYQALDPAVVLGEPGAPERLELARLHQIVEGAFRRSHRP